MPFQDKIDSSPWKAYCVSYNDTKRAIYDMFHNGDKSVIPERELQDLLQVEIDKLNLFTVIKYEDIFRSLQSLANSVSVPADIAHDRERRADYLSRLESSIDSVADEIVNLDKYVRTNCEGLIKLVSKFDEILNTSVVNWFIARLSKEEFCNVNFQSLLILLSLTWSKYRSSLTTAKEEGTWRPPESFVRSTAKYWVKPENIPRLKASILKHLPYLIFGSSLKEQETFLDPTTLFEASSDSGAISETQLITSIYFDNTNRDIYRQRILRKEGARLVRFRWYGTNEGSPDQEIFIERKIHHESWSNEASSKDRFVVKQKDVFKFMKGQYDLSSVKKNVTELAIDVDKLIQELNLQPFIRTCYYRCAFQLSTSNDVRISLDTQMSLINEFKPNSHPSEPWCRLASDVLAEEDLVRFPYAILEVKLADARNPPAWVESMLESCGAIQVHKFSKFLHAMAFLHPDNTTLFPHWFNDFIKEPKKLPKQYERLNTHRLEEILISQSSEDTTESAPEPRRLKDMKSIEPKSIFANERTFLHYTQKAIFLLTIIVGVGMRFGKDPPVLVLLLQMGLAVIMGIYMVGTFLQFNHRQKTLLGRKSVEKIKSRLDIQGGPVMAAGIILIGCLTNFAVTALRSN